MYVLDNAYSSWRQKGLCCVIPGAALDEAFRLLRLARSLAPMKHWTRDEDNLQNLATMAREHLKEVIEPRLRRIEERTAHTRRPDAGRARFPSLALASLAAAHHSESRRVQGLPNSAFSSGTANILLIPNFPTSQCMYLGAT